MHHGIDLHAHNEYVYSMMDGKVEKVGYDARSGNYIILRHADFTISYCHLSKVHIAPGAPVLPAPSLVNQAPQDVQQASICI